MQGPTLGQGLVTLAVLELSFVTAGTVRDANQGENRARDREPPPWMEPSIPGDHQPLPRGECGCAGNKGQTGLGRVLWCLHSPQGSLVVLEDLAHPQISEPEMNYWGQLRQEQMASH